MNNKTRNPEQMPDEKKVWRGVSMEPYYPKDGDNLPPGIYFMAIEELQGAWIGDGPNSYWEEAEGGTEEWDETYTDDEGVERARTVTREILRARRYVLKRFESNGKVRNAHDGAYSGVRRYKD